MKSILVSLVILLSIALVYSQEPTVKILQSQLVDGKACEPSQTVSIGDSVSILYVGKLEDGQVFDASEKHGGHPFTFQLGQGKVIPGMEFGVLGACLGEKREVLIPYQLAYGERGIEGVIPEKSNLIFGLEVVNIEKLSELPLYLRIIPTKEIVGAFTLLVGFVVAIGWVVKNNRVLTEKKMPKTKAPKEKKEKKVKLNKSN
ncbi:FKBP-type peptidylprolyl cis-trans isomerase [Tieghemostelium lacteum]|uniref:peptidylprolyl isomerase n=1 Tax=Tieghemostelium lacteum TaxID=361077 RepID=A0A151ZK00_TIELA|nr:FKBP-type peptidylprolyl cis-trans isomerase [Tieghemostelium lacteum]|eukprot:KYQ94210.1 FKBP-type peptidylprolyl cis-trans isomerase [Tieghemostelium lacteum]